jgi:ubiquinone biosynthesis protein Coq4
MIIQQNLLPIERIQLENRTVNQFTSHLIQLVFSLVAKAKNTGDMEAAYRISNAATQLTPLTVLKAQIRWLQECDTTSVRMLSELKLESDTTIDPKTLELYNVKTTSTLGSVTKAYFFDKNRYDPLEPVSGIDALSKVIAVFHNYLRANHEFLHVILGIGTSEIEEIMIHTIMTELMPSPLSAYLTAYLTTAGYTARGFIPIRELYSPLQAFKKNGTEARLTFEALLLSRKIGRQLKNKESPIMTANFTTDGMLNSSIAKIRKEVGITRDITFTIKSFLERVEAFKRI